MKHILATTALSLVLITPALAGNGNGANQNHTCQGGHNCTSGGGAGGAGGVGGAGGAGGAGGNAFSHSNATSMSRANATGGNARATGGRTTSSTGPVTVTVGGSSLSTSSTGGSSTGGSASAPAAGLTAGASQGNGSSGGGDPTINYSGGYTVHNTPDVMPPSVIGGNACAVGASGGVAMAGFGIAAGATWADKACERRQEAALLYNMGVVKAASELLCQDDSVRAAMKTAGTPCAADAVVVKPVAAIAAPIVAATVAKPARPEWCYTASWAEKQRHPECRQ